MAKHINLSKVASLIRRFILFISKIKWNKLALQKVFSAPNKLKQPALEGGLPCKIHYALLILRLALLRIHAGLRTQPGKDLKYF